MVPLPLAEDAAGLIGLLLVAIPFGSLLLRLAERWLGRTLPFTVVERLLVSFYATGLFFFVLASLPLPLFQPAVVVGLLAIGIGGRLGLAFRSKGRDLAPLLRFLRSPGAVVVAGLGALVLVVELVGGAMIPLGNAVDGSVYALFVQLLLTNHTLPWTLQPYAATGVVYPQGAPVWMALPAILFGWPSVALPVVLPSLFFALSVPAAFCLGQRILGAAHPRAELSGVVCAAFFGLVAAFPRLFLGGSFDFVFSLPLFLLFVGWLPSLSTRNWFAWRTTVALGIALGTAAVLSATTGMSVTLLVLVFGLGPAVRNGPALSARAVRLLAAIAIEVALLARSLAGLAVWWNYPGHVLAAVGSPPYASYGFSNTLTSSTLVGELDPFVPWKPKLSPYPSVSLTVALLLAAGLVLLLLNLLRNRPGLRSMMPVAWARTALAVAGTLFLEELALIVGSGVNSSAGGLQSLSNINEVSVLLFIAYELIALVPLLLCAFVLADYWSRRTQAPEVPSTPDRASRARDGSDSPSKVQGPRPRLIALGAALVLLVPVLLGAGVTVVETPSYIQDHFETIANITAGDIAALEWAGGHLPDCSRVLVAPGSAAQYLPEFAKVGLVFPTFPPTVNESYYQAVQDLIVGNYSGGTRADLLAIGATEVFVTGQTQTAYAPFRLAPLLVSPDFTLLTEYGDAAILAFEPGVASAGCSP